MTYFIVDKLNKNVHNYSNIIPHLCQISSDDNAFKLRSLNETELKELFLYKHYNGCRYCLRKYHFEKIA